MGKMSELDLTLKEIKEHVKAIDSLVDDLYNLFSSKPAEEEPPKKEEIKFSLEEVRSLLAQKSRDGFTKEVKALLLRFGANKLSEVKQEDYQELYMQAEEIGHDS